jgi:hypothetical protein
MTLNFCSSTYSSVVQVTSSLPISIYFLNFINYFSMTSLYVLLNFPIPEHIYYLLEYFYRQLNENLLNMMGISLPAYQISSEKVDSQRALYFGVTSDYFPNGTATFALFAANIIFIFLLQFLTTCLRKRNFFRQLIANQKRMIIFGQIINLMHPIVLPWAFHMLQMGCRNWKDMISILTYIFVFFMAFAFPFYYFLELFR